MLLLKIVEAVQCIKKHILIFERCNVEFRGIIVDGRAKMQCGGGGWGGLLQMPASGVMFPSKILKSSRLFYIFA